MDQISPKSVLEIIGESHFAWLAREFNQETVLKEIPDVILDRISGVDTTRRDYSNDQEGMTSIALITFAYNLAGKAQQAHDGPKDMMLLKVLAKNEKARRGGKERSGNIYWDKPLCELLTGEVGEKIREMKMITDPGDPHF